MGTVEAGRAALEALSPEGKLCIGEQQVAGAKGGSNVQSPSVTLRRTSSREISPRDSSKQVKISGAQDVKRTDTECRRIARDASLAGRLVDALCSSSPSGQPITRLTECASAALSALLCQHPFALGARSAAYIHTLVGLCRRLQAKGGALKPNGSSVVVHSHATYAIFTLSRHVVLGYTGERPLNEETLARVQQLLDGQVGEDGSSVEGSGEAATGGSHGESVPSPRGKKRQQQQHQQQPFRLSPKEVDVVIGMLPASRHGAVHGSALLWLLARDVGAIGQLGEAGAVEALSAAFVSAVELGGGSLTAGGTYALQAVWSCNALWRLCTDPTNAARALAAGAASMLAVLPSAHVDESLRRAALGTVQLMMSHSELLQPLRTLQADGLVAALARRNDVQVDMRQTATRTVESVHEEADGAVEQLMLDLLTDPNPDMRALGCRGLARSAMKGGERTIVELGGAKALSAQLIDSVGVIKRSTVVTAAARGRRSEPTARTSSSEQPLPYEDEDMPSPMPSPTPSPASSELGEAFGSELLFDAVNAALNLSGAKTAQLALARHGGLAALIELIYHLGRHLQPAATSHNTSHSGGGSSPSPTAASRSPSPSPIHPRSPSPQPKTQQLQQHQASPPVSPRTTQPNSSRTRRVTRAGGQKPGKAAGGGLAAQARRKATGLGNGEHQEEKDDDEALREARRKSEAHCKELFMMARSTLHNLSRHPGNRTHHTHPTLSVSHSSRHLASLPATLSSSRLLLAALPPAHLPSCLRRTRHAHVSHGAVPQDCAVE